MYHPESDGATERANHTITQMLRQCIKPNQKDWVLRLPAIEFAINSAHSESTGVCTLFPELRTYAKISDMGLK